jgi:hypothetical protein
MFGDMDLLTYNYYPDGNKLKKVTDNSTQDNAIGVDFKELSDELIDYDYDDNGNLLFDKNKDISVIKYNHLNQPVTISFLGNRKIEYLYDALGTKIKKRVLEKGMVVSEIQYSGNFVYKSDFNHALALEYIIHPEGRLVASTTEEAYDIEYYLKDHLGNTRLTFCDDKTNHGTPKVLQ